MKFPPFALALGISTLLLHTSCKPKSANSDLESAPPRTDLPTPAVGENASPPDTQPTLPPPPPQGNAGGNRPGGGTNFQQRADERMEKMKTEVGLSDEQAQKIRNVYDQQFGSLRGQMRDGSMSREDRRAAFEKARSAANAEIEQILTPEQKPKWEAFQKEMEQRRQERRGGGN